MKLTHEAELKTLQRDKQGWAEENAPLCVTYPVLHKKLFLPYTALFEIYFFSFYLGHVRIRVLEYNPYIKCWKTKLRKGYMEANGFRSKYTLGINITLW